MNKKFKKMLIFLGIFIIILVLAVVVYMQQPQFGKAPSGKRLERIKQSKHYKNGAFQNVNPTPSFGPGYNYANVLWDFLVTQYPNTKPTTKIPSLKTDLKSLPKTENVFIWMGHSSYFMQIDGKKYLIDPVLSGNASPISGTTKSFEGSDVYKPADIPEIDFLLITHDHYDHLDYETIKDLLPKIKKVICGLGVGEHLEYWGYNPKIIHELDWEETLNVGDSITIHTTTARHFSGRTFKRNNTLWVSFVLETPDLKLFIGGDSGYDTHFKSIGEKFGPLDWVILENGQYDKKWPYIHMIPEETALAARELQAKQLIPVHNSKFKLAHHPWNEPIEKVILEAKKINVSMVKPMIGQKIILNNL